MSVTDDGELKGLSIEGSDVRRTPRLAVGAALIREVGVRADGQGGISSSGSGGRRGTPRLVVLLFGWFLLLEETGFDGHSGDSGDQMEVPSVVVWTAKRAV